MPHKGPLLTGNFRKCLATSGSVCCKQLEFPTENYQRDLLVLIVETQTIVEKTIFALQNDQHFDQQNTFLFLNKIVV